ncbi:glucuronate isomerase [Pleomorphomonas diazotrophica]|uniref:Uronate isomerase n=1 Tax=Pleomorphomonas diazotrophica TaxID=1166257 RepID=A0A1I4UUZ6_9HYPH|nr:glucuronate isomerase [Pleomorphomonas diazotrophica]PKR89795.1 glucuronate isomerase [Pleomorphomonas diazotrophica]SFM92792.1 glucuronate isomerase [Pleomorphomonas diazotrophica]
MSGQFTLHPDRLFPADPATRAIARELHAGIANLPIISPHGHTDPAWFAENQPFPDPASLFIIPDHYVLRMLYSQGIGLDELGVPRLDGGPVETDKRKIWRILAENFHVYRGTPSYLWLTHAFQTVFGITEVPSKDNADRLYDIIAEALEKPEFRPRALYERFNIEVIATTEGPLDDLRHHRKIRESGWKGRVISAFRPDPVVDPDVPGFADNLQALGRLTGQDTATYRGYLQALADRRRYFMEVGGATSTDHGHPTARTADLQDEDAAALYDRVRQGGALADDAELFRAQMLTEMARMSTVDGLVMQIHAGPRRDHNPEIFSVFGKDKGGDMPGPTGYVDELRPLLARFGNRADLTVILFTLDETAYARELAPLAGHYPALRLGPAWWFHDSPEGMRRYREQMTETAGFYNTVGFNDDTRAFLSIPARHDVARRADCAFLARLVAEHRLGLDEAREVAHDLAYRLAKTAYRL